MRKSVFRGSLAAGIALLLWGAPAPVGAQGQQALVIQGGTLIDGNGGAPIANSVIVIQGNQITAAGRAGQVQVPAGAQVVNANGKWIVPGLWDSQLNYSWFYGEPMLNQGVTSSIDIGNGEELSILHRAAVNHGKIRGPRTFIGVGHFGGIQPGESTGLESDLSTRQVPKTPEEARTLAKKFIAAGADMIMFHDGGFAPEIVAAGCDEAHKAGKACTLRAGGPKSTPKEGALANVDFIPHSQGVAQAVMKDGVRAQNELDRYADMDDAKANDLIKVLVEHHVNLVPAMIHNAPTYPKDWARMQAALDTAFTDPNLRAYYPADFYAEMRQTRTRYDQGDVRARRMKGYQNMLRFNKMYDAAGGHVLVGGDTNGGKVAGYVVHDEMEIFQEAGIPQMHIIQGATKWPAEALKMGDKIGTIEAGRLADLVIVNADPLKDIANLRNIDTVVFDGKVADRTYHASYSTTFMGKVDDIRVVEDLGWTRTLKAATFRQGGGGNANANAPDPFESPQPAIEQILPVMVTQGAPNTMLTLKGFNFVAQSRVYFDGVSVPYRRVSPTELQVTLDENLLRRAGRFDIVVVNPDPQTLPQWGNGTSNKAHLLVDYKY